MRRRFSHQINQLGIGTVEDESGLPRHSSPLSLTLLLQQFLQVPQQTVRISWKIFLHFNERILISALYKSQRHPIKSKINLCILVHH
jgi:hypothetical protein